MTLILLPDKLQIKYKSPEKDHWNTDEEVVKTDKMCKVPHLHKNAYLAELTRLIIVKSNERKFVEGNLKIKKYKK